MNGRPSTFGSTGGAALEIACELGCPQCGARHAETMPLDACIYFYECKSCAVLLKPKPGDCCVFCSYGTIPCPPMQMGATCKTADCGPGGA